MAVLKNAWTKWIGSIAQDARLVSSHQLGFEGKVISKEEIQNGFLRELNQSVSGNLVLKANNFEEACETAKSYPILAASGSVEIRNTLNVF